MQIFQNIIRPELLSIAPYKSARSESSGHMPAIALDANECPWPPFAADAENTPLHRYPTQQPQDLLQRLAAIYNVAPEAIFIGRGSDEGIDLLVRLCCRAGQDSILICPPTFGMYEFYANVQAAAVQHVPLLAETYQLDVPAILSACSEKTKLLFIPSPHAPMGHFINRQDVLQLCETLKDKALVIVDEAYVEFSGMPEGFVDQLVKYENLVILRTLSKAHALAGERLGCVIANPLLVSYLQRIAAPYPLPQSVIKTALQALSAAGLARTRDLRRILVGERTRMKKMLLQSPRVKKIFQSEANFLLLQTENAIDFMQTLLSFGIRARSRSGDLPEAVRLTIGTPQENDAVLQALDIPLEDEKLSSEERFASVQRATRETAINITVNLDHYAPPMISSGIGFFDHMLQQVATHGHFALTLNCRGDLDVDAHHTIEDCGIALGEALRRALGDKKGVARFAFTAPLDEAVASVVLDLSGRAFSQFEGAFPAQMIGEMPSEMVPHFFTSFANALQAALHIKVEGDNAHHMAEACFKSLGRALRQAVQREGAELPSTKGVL